MKMTKNKKKDDMPWNKKNYPDAFKNLNVKTRNKAIEIGNALIEKEKMEEGRAISIAISKAREWADSDHQEKTKP